MATILLAGIKPVTIGEPSGCDLWIGEKDVEISILTGTAGNWRDSWWFQYPIVFSNIADETFAGAYISSTASTYEYSAWFIAYTEQSSTVFECRIDDINEPVYYSKYTIDTLDFTPAAFTHIEEGILEDVGSNRHWDRYILIAPPYTVYRIAAHNPVNTLNKPVQLS